MEAQRLELLGGTRLTPFALRPQDEWAAGMSIGPAFMKRGT